MNYEKTVEERTRLDVLNMNIKEAIDLIVERELVYHVLEQDGQYFERTDPCYISHRLNLIVRRGRVIGTEIY